MNEIILVGGGGHAGSCLDVIESTGLYKVAGLVTKDKTSTVATLSGYPIIGEDKDLESLRGKYSYALVATGQIKSALLRIKLFNLLKSLEFKLPVIISPRSSISISSKISNGTIIMHDVLINRNVKIGENCIINSKSLIEHDTLIEDHCHISTGVILNGGVIVGSESFIGSGVVTKESISIGRRCVIGAGAVIKSNIDHGSMIKK